MDDFKWSSELAYVVGLITTDGSLSIDGRHINLTSKDIEQIELFALILGLKNKIGTKTSTYNPQGKYYQIQFGNIKFYRFLLSIGLTPNKTKTLGSIDIPDLYFADFLRGHLDGDGCTYSYWDKRWKNSYMLYTTFVSASEQHIEWVKDQIKNLYGLEGKINNTKRSYFQLRYAKSASVKLLENLYYDPKLPYLKRKRFKIEQSLGIIRKNAGVL